MRFLQSPKYAISGLATLLVLSIPAIALANPIFPAKRQIGVSQAMGVSGVTASVSLSPMQSLNISFINTGEAVKKVWLGNPHCLYNHYLTSFAVEVGLVHRDCLREFVVMFQNSYL